VTKKIGASTTTTSTRSGAARAKSRLGDHRDRAHAQCDADEEREHAAVGLAQQRGRQEEAARDAEPERDHQAGGTHPRRGRTAAPDEPDIHVRAGDADEQQHADLARDVQGGRLRGDVSDQLRDRLGRERPEQGRPERHARAQLAQHRRQPDPPGQPAHHGGGGQHERELRDQGRDRRGCHS
jgi:hypothetical protein